MTKFFCRNKSGKKNGEAYYSGLVVRLELDREDRRFTFHGLRKTFIHAAYHSGVALKKIQTIAGHHTDFNEIYGLPKGYEDHTDVTFNYILRCDSNEICKQICILLCLLWFPVLAMLFLVYFFCLKAHLNSRQITMLAVFFCFCRVLTPDFSYGS